MMKKRHRISAALLFSLIPMAAPPIASSETLNIPRKLTTHTSDDFQPAVSPDGKSIAFVSNRSGNNDIWLVPAAGGPARQLTTHTASDTDPAWSRDGKTIAFTSLREDAKGDIWTFDIENGNEKRITGPVAAESYPSWFPDGKRMAFSRGNEVWSIDLQSGKEDRLFQGLYPSVSPDGKFIAYIAMESRGGVAPPRVVPPIGSIWVYRLNDKTTINLTKGDFSDAFPSWSLDGKEIFFSRFSEDTNGDGVIDAKDNPSIWKIIFTDSPIHQFTNSPLQLTSGSSYELFPSADDANIFFAAAQGKDFDIYTVTKVGEVPDQKTAKEQLDLAYKVKEPLRRLLAFRKLLSEELIAEARYQVAMTYLQMGRRKETERELRTVSSFKTGRRWISMAEIELARIGAEDAAAAGNRDGALKEIGVLKEIIARYKDQPYSQAMAQVRIGDVYLLLKDDIQALREYEFVRESYPAQVDAVAQARLNMAEIYSSYGDESRLTETYVSIIKDYPASTEWGLTASQKVLSLIDRIDDEKERLSRYRMIASKYRGLPYLPALAQYKAGEHYHTRGLLEEALTEYRKVLDDYPSEDLVADEASIAMAEIELSRRAYGRALTIYEPLLKKGNGQAVQLYINASLEKARAEMHGKEPAQAIKSYRAAIDLDFNEVRAHRGMIEAYAVKGEAGTAVSIYRDEVKRRPESDIAHYALGLANTYLEPPALDAAEAEIKKALSINYSLPFAHQTLGWVYEIKDKLGNGRSLGMAVDEYEAALALFPQSMKKEIADLLLNIGNGYSALGNNEKAYEYYKRRVESGVGFDDPRREAVFYENMGNAASRAGRYAEAAPYYMKTLDYAVKNKERSWELKVTEELGLLYQEARDYDRAAGWFSKALKIAEEGKMEEKRALLLRNIGYNAYHAGRTEEAIQYFNRSLDALGVKEEAAAKGGGLLTIKKALTLGKEGSEAFMGFERTGEEKLIYSYLGKAYAETGEYESALEGMRKKLELIPREGRETERGILLNNLGVLHFQVGDTEKAYGYFKESMETSVKSKNFTGEMVNIVNLGLLAAYEGRGDRPVAPTEESIQLQEKGIAKIAAEKRGKEYLPYLKNNLGLLYLNSVVGGRWPVAGEKKSIDLNSLVATSLGSLSQDRDNLKKAAEQFRSGLAILEKQKDPWLAAVLELNLAAALYHAGSDKEALNRLTSAMKLMEQEQLADLKWRGLWLMAELDGKNREKHFEDAVAALEKTTQPSPDLRPPSPTGRGVGGEGTDLYKELISLLFSTDRLDDAFSYAEKMEIARLKQEAIKARYPMPKEEAPLSARDAQWFLDEKTAIVRYLAADDRLFIWYIDADDIVGKQVKISKYELEKGVTDFLSSLDRKEMTDKLSPVLIKPVADLISKKKQLYIMPDPVLSGVPFAALSLPGTVPILRHDKAVSVNRDSPLVPLIDRFHISYAPSAYILNAGYEKRNLNKVNILISQGAGYPEEYVEGIGSKTPIFAALKSNREKFVEMSSNYGMLHITDTFAINRTAPFRSSFRFDNGRLLLSELAPLKLNPNLVVLTNPDPTSHVSRLTSHAIQPLILSGPPSVLVKTSPSSKESEELFMKEFYDAFRKESAAGALAKAQRVLKAKGLGPEVWAGYSLYGYAGMNQEEERKYASKKVADIMNSAIEAYSKGDWKGSIKRFEEGLLFLKTIGAKENLGSIYQALAKASANTGDYVKGAYYQEEFLKTAAGKMSKQEEADGYKNVGILYSRAGDSKKAEESVSAAVKLWKETGNRKSLAEGYRTLALLQEKGGDYQGALASFTSSLEVARELRDRSTAGQNLWDIGRIYYLRLSRLDDAMKGYNEALSTFKAIGDREKTARVLLDIGLVHEQEGEYESAKSGYLEGVEIAKEINDKTAYSRGSLYLANVAWHTGDYQEAFRRQKVALNTAIELKDRKQEAMAHNLAGLTYMNLGMLEKALESLSSSLSISIETQDRLDTAAAYNNIGLVQRELGDLEKSLESFRNALSIDQELKSRRGTAYDMRNLGISFERMGRLNESLENMRSSLSISREIGERKNETMTLYSLGMLHVRMGKEKDASETLSEAYRLGKELNLPEVVWRSRKALASIHAGMNRTAEAYEELKEAITVVEGMRGRIKVDEYKTGFLENKTDLYEEMVLLLLRMGRTEEAFNYAERARSRNFIDMLGNQKVNLKSAASQKMLDGERALRRRIETLEEKARGSAAAIEELTKARKEYEALLIEIKSENPELAAFVTVEPPALPDIQKTIPAGAALLEYMATKDGIVIWTVTGSKIESSMVPVSREALKEKVVRYREMLERATPLEKESLELYNILIKPVEGSITGAKNICIIPNDVLHYLSFSSLFDGKKYLMEEHAISYAPAAGVLKMIAERRVTGDERRVTRKSSSSSPVTRHSSRLLVVGNPDLGDPAFDLPFAEREAGSIVREYDGSELLLRKEATETKVKEEIGKFDGVHFASHGVYDSATPLFSTLKLAKDGNNDGNLTANETFSLEIKASLVMMSACQTGLGKLTTGDEIIGLNRAFIYAGASSIISTLWRVNDASSAMLVKRFYRNYKDHDPAESLRLAQMAVKEYYPHPAYWAAFGLTGEFR